MSKMATNRRGEKRSAPFEFHDLAGNVAKKKDQKVMNPDDKWPPINAFVHCCASFANAMGYTQADWLDITKMNSLGAQVASVINEIRQHRNLATAPTENQKRVGPLRFVRENGNISEDNVEMEMTADMQKSLIKVIYQKYGLDLDNTKQMGIVQMMLVLLTSFKHEVAEVLYGTSVIAKSKEKITGEDVEKATAINIKDLGCPEAYSSLFKGVNFPPVYRSTLGNSNGVGTMIYMYRTTANPKYKAKWLHLAVKAMKQVPFATAIVKYMAEAGVNDMMHAWSFIGQHLQLGRIKTSHKGFMPVSAFMVKVGGLWNPARVDTGNRWEAATGQNGWGWKATDWTLGNPYVGKMVPMETFKGFDFSGRGFWEYLYSIRDRDFIVRTTAKKEPVRQLIFLAMTGTAFEEQGIVNAMCGMKFLQRKAMSGIKLNEGTEMHIKLIVPKFVSRLASSTVAFNTGGKSSQIAATPVFAGKVTVKLDPIFVDSLGKDPKMIVDDPAVTKDVWVSENEKLLNKIKAQIRENGMKMDRGGTTWHKIEGVSTAGEGTWGEPVELKVEQQSLYYGDPIDDEA